MILGASWSLLLKETIVNIFMNLIMQKANLGRAVWPPEIMTYLYDSCGILSVSYPFHFFDIVDEIFLFIFCLIKKIPNMSRWIHDLSPEDYYTISRYHNLCMSGTRASGTGRNSIETSRARTTRTTSNVSSTRSNNKRKISDLRVNPGVTFARSVGSVNQSVRRPVELVNQSNVWQTRCHRNGLGLDFSFMGR